MKAKIQETMFLWAVMALPAVAGGQDRIKASAGADLVSGYVWRGRESGDVGIQPSVPLSWKGLSPAARGSASWGSEYAKELDLTLGYAVGGCSVPLTDYGFSKGTNFKTGVGVSGKYFHFGSQSTLHVYEAQAGYDFGFLAVDWYADTGGNDGRKKDGKRVYSPCFSLSSPFRLGGLDRDATAGAVPWGGFFLRRRLFGLRRVRGGLAGGQGRSGNRIVRLALVCQGHVESGHGGRLLHGGAQFLSITGMRQIPGRVSRAGKVV